VPAPAAAVLTVWNGEVKRTPALTAAAVLNSGHVNSARPAAGGAAGEKPCSRAGSLARDKTEGWWGG